MVNLLDGLNRLNSINAIFGSLPLHALNNKSVLKRMSQTNVNNLKQWIYNQSFIFSALEKSLLGLIKQSGKVRFQQTGGNPYQTMFQVFIILLVLAATLIESSNEMVVNSQKSEPAFEWLTNRVVETKVVNVINVPGTITHMVGSFTYKWPLNTAIYTLFQEIQRDISKLLKEIRGKCLLHGKQNKAYTHIEYITTEDGSQKIDSITQKPPTYDKDTQMAACFEINPLPFNFNPNTGNIEFIHVNMPLNQVTEILYTIVGDMESVIKATAPNQDKELVEAYNAMLIIANGLEKIGELLFDVLSPVVFNANTIDEYRIESLKDSFDAIIKEMSQMKDLLNLKNPIQRMAAENLISEANEKLTTEEMIAYARKTSREADTIKSQQNVQDTSVYYGNKFDENMAPLKSIGKKVLEVPVDFVGAVSDAAVNTVLAPVNSVFKGAKETIMNNKFIMILAALGVFVTGVVTITIAKNKLTIIYKVGNLIKKIVLLPITVTMWIGKQIKVLLYRPKVEETTPTTTPTLQIDNGPDVPDVTTTTTIVPLETTTPVVVKRKPRKEDEKLVEITKMETELARVIEMYSNFEKNGTKAKLPGIKRRIVELTENLESLKAKAKGTRKRNNKKNTKKNKKRLPVKPSRKFKLRK